MEITGKNKLRKIIVVGDRVLIKPKRMSERTESGLYLPPGVPGKRKGSEWLYYENRPWLSHTNAC